MSFKKQKSLKRVIIPKMNKNVPQVANLPDKRKPERIVMCQFYDLGGLESEVKQKAISEIVNNCNEKKEQAN